MPDIETAREFFMQLEKFSRKARAHCTKDKAEDASPWGDEQYKSNPPDGCIIHYTASCVFETTIDWFCDRAKNAKASAHLVVARQQVPWAAELAKPYPLVAALPVTVVQIRQPQQSAWHATWANAECYGIELMNAGELRGEKGNYTWWPEDFRAKYPHGELPLLLYGRLWERWPLAQVRACAALISYANAYFGRSFKEHMILGHENVQGVKTVHCGNHDKRDPGPGFPLGMVRDTALSLSDHLSDVYLSAESVQKRHADIIRGVFSMGNLTDEQVLAKLQSRVREPVGDALPPERLAISILDILGYAVRYEQSPGQSMLEKKPNGESLKVFKTLMGLPKDSVLDHVTWQNLYSRLADRLFPSTPAVHVA